MSLCLETLPTNHPPPGRTSLLLVSVEMCVMSDGLHTVQRLLLADGLGGKCCAGDNRISTEDFDSTEIAQSK